MDKSDDQKGQQNEHTWIDYYENQPLTPEELASVGCKSIEELYNLHFPDTGQEPKEPSVQEPSEEPRPRSAEDPLPEQEPWN